MGYAPLVTYLETRAGVGYAHFEGPGGSTEIYMPERNARAIATALGVDFTDERETK